VGRFLVVAIEHGYWYRLLPCNTRKSFANSQTKTLSTIVEIYFPTRPKPSSTKDDILDDGDVPILMSLDQTCNLRLDLRFRAEQMFLYLQQPWIFSRAVEHLHLQSRRYKPYEVVATISWHARVNICPNSNCWRRQPAISQEIQIVR